LGSILASASPAEVRLAEQTLDAVSVPRAGRGRPKKRLKDLLPIKDMTVIHFDNVLSV